MSYSTKLKTDEWKTFRDTVLSEKGYDCEICACHTDSPHIHHAGYQRGLEPWEYEVEDMRVLCGECHSVVHERQKEFRNYMGTLSLSAKSLLVQVMEAFNSSEMPGSLLVERMYTYMRDQRYEGGSEKQRLIYSNELKSHDKYAIENSLLRLRIPTLDALLDGLDHLKELNESQVSIVLRNLVPQMRKYEDDYRSELGR